MERKSEVVAIGSDSKMFPTEQEAVARSKMRRNDEMWGISGAIDEGVMNSEAVEDCGKASDWTKVSRNVYKELTHNRIMQSSDLQIVPGHGLSN